MKLYTLLNYLAVELPSDPVVWQGWRIRRVTGGRTNLLFRAVNEQNDLVVKFTQRDARERARREFYALTLMQARCPGLAPLPVLLDCDRYPHQVVVHQWLEGEAWDTPPGNPGEWQRLVEHYAAIHTVTPDGVEPELLARLKPAALTFRHAPDAARFVMDDSAKLPQEGWTEALRTLFERLERARFPGWPEPPCSFDRCDPYIANFLRYSDGRPWASVDWENSGWGDPAFEIADVMTHPSYKDVTGEQWEWFIHACAERCPEDETFLLRARAYHAIILVRWARLFAGFVSQWERGDLNMGRLVAWPRSWWEGVPADYQHYLNTAHSALSEYSKPKPHPAVRRK